MFKSTVNQTVAELKIQRLKAETVEIEERYTKLNEAVIQMKSLVTTVAIVIAGLVSIPFLISAVYTESVIPLFLGSIIEFIVFFIWLKKIESINADFEKTSKPMIEKGIQIKKKISDLNKIVED